MYPDYLQVVCDSETSKGKGFMFFRRVNLCGVIFFSGSHEDLWSSEMRSSYFEFSLSFVHQNR